MISIDTISQETREKISHSWFDRMIEKHEGPFNWKYLLNRSPETDEMMYKFYPDYNPIAEIPEFIDVDDTFSVLLPRGRKHNANLKFLHYFLSQDSKKIVIYLTDSTFEENEGFLAICDLVEPENFYIATVYHEWFITQYDIQRVTELKAYSETKSY
jgi:hypothetical protein